MKRSRFLLVEVVVVTAALVVLGIVMFPRFYNSQVGVQVARAKRDLHSIIQAMEAYNLDRHGAGAQAVFAWRDWMDESSHTFDAFSDNLPSPRARLRQYPIAADAFAPYLDPVPVPHLPLEVNGAPLIAGWGPMYGVARWELRNKVHHFNSPTDIEQGIYWYNFYKDYYNAGYLGLSHGPFINHDYSKPPTMFGLNYGLKYQTYDPSNGLMSHGYIVQDTTPTNYQKLIEFPDTVGIAAQWNDRPRALQADTSQPAMEARIEDAASLAAHHKILFSTLDVTFYGTSVQNMPGGGILFQTELNSRFRPDAVLGRLPDGVTPKEVDEYYERMEKAGQEYPVEITHLFSGDDKQVKRFKSPRGTRMPWSTSEEYILNGDAAFQNDYTKKQFTLTDRSQGLFPFEVVCFNPLPLLVPLRSVEALDAVTMERVSETLYRVKWKKPLDQGYPETIFWLDALVDSSKGYLPLKVEIAYSMEPLLRASKRESEVPYLTGMFGEFTDFRVINGVHFPLQWKITSWTYAREGAFDNAQSDDDDEASPKPDYVIEGLKPLNIIDSGELPPFYSQWELQVEAVSVNQPLEEELFWTPVPAGFKYRDARDRTDEKSGTGVYTFKR